MTKIRFHGGIFTERDKDNWTKQAKKEGFNNLWAWINWLAHNRVNGDLVMKPPQDRRE